MLSNMFKELGKGLLIFETPHIITDYYQTFSIWTFLNFVLVNHCSESVLKPDFNSTNHFVKRGLQKFVLISASK